MDYNKLTFRKLCADDMDLFIKFRFDFLNEFFKDDGETTEKIRIPLKNYFDKYINSDEFIGIICEYNNEIVSGAYLTISYWAPNKIFLNGKIGTLLNVYTYPNYRKNGIGTKVIEKIIEEAKKQEVSIINLLATEYGEGVYKKLGFVETKDKSMRLTFNS